MSMNGKKPPNCSEAERWEDVCSAALWATQLIEPGISMLVDGTHISASGLICHRDCDITVTVSVRRLLLWEREQRAASLASICGQDGSATRNGPAPK